MDYSLLLIIESLSKQSVSKSRNVFISRDGLRAYHMGIIDFLQDWSFEKKVENRLKGKGNKISAVPPADYQSRFEKFIIYDVLKPGAEVPYKEYKNSFIKNL
jgi:hypothetical protein